MAITGNAEQVAQVNSNLYNSSQINSDIKTKQQMGSKMTPTNVVSIYYEGGETQDIIVNIDNDKKTISAQLKSIQYQSVGEFPNVGSENQVYLDISTNTPYRFDTATLTYIRLGSDWRDIEIIDGGNA